MPATIEDFNRTVNQLTDLANELAVNATSAEIIDEETDEGTAEILNVFFDHPQANPLTMNAAQ